MFDFFFVLGLLEIVIIFFYKILKFQSFIKVLSLSL